MGGVSAGHRGGGPGPPYRAHRLRAGPPERERPPRPRFRAAPGPRPRRPRRRPAHRGPRREPGPRGPGAHRRRRGADQLHLRDERHPQGRDERPRQHHGQRRTPARRPPDRRGFRLLRARPALPHHRHGLPVRRLRRQRGHPRPGLPLRGGRRPGGLRRPPPRLHRRPVHRLHGAGRASGRHPGPLRLVPGDLLRRRAAAARARGEVPRGLRPVHPQRLRTHRVHRPLRLGPARARGPGGPGLGHALRGRTRPRHLRPDPRRDGPGGPLRGAGRDRGARPPGRLRLLEPPRGHGRRLPGRRAAHRRHRLHGRGGLAVRRRPQEGHDQRLRVQGVAARGGGCPLHPPGGARGGRRGRARRVPGRRSGRT